MNTAEFTTRYSIFTIGHAPNTPAWDDYDIASNAFFEDIPLTASYMALAPETMILELVADAGDDFFTSTLP